MPIITITRGSLSATQKLTDRLAKDLHCRAISREDIIEHGKKYGIDEFLQAAQKIMESKPPESWDPQAAQIRNYLTIFKAALLDFVVEGDIIYHGLQTHFLLTDFPSILKIKVIAPFEFRVRTLMDECGPDFDQQAKYDMILSMANLNLDSMVEIVALVTRKAEFRIHGGVMKDIKNAQQKTMVMAYLVRASATRDIDFSVECDSEKGLVKIKCDSPPSDTADWKKDVKKALEGLENISTLEIT